MARKKANQIKWEKQRRARVDQLKLAELSRAGHRRVTDNRIVTDIYGIVPDDLTRDFSNAVRKLVGLGECDVTSSREEVLAKINWVASRAELVFRQGNSGLYLIQVRDGYYFLFREKGHYYKKSITYQTRTRAMERYEQDRPGILWLHFFDEKQSKPK